MINDKIKLQQNLAKVFEPICIIIYHHEFRTFKFKPALSSLTHDEYLTRSKLAATDDNNTKGFTL